MLPVCITAIARPAEFGGVADSTAVVVAWTERLKAFDQWSSLGGADTQTSSKAAEAFFQTASQDSLPGACVLKLSRQERMDFAIGLRLVEPDVLAFVEGHNTKARRRAGKPKDPTEELLRTWQDGEGTRYGIEFLFVQVKSGDGIFTLNDTFPPPDEDLLYVFFDQGSQKVFVTLSSHLARAYTSSPPISDRYRRSRAAMEEFRASLKAIWEGTVVGTYTRPTYSIALEYARNEPPPEELVRVLSRAKAI
jgi:hypothetical protein